MRRIHRAQHVRNTHYGEPEGNQDEEISMDEETDVSAELERIEQQRKDAIAKAEQDRIDALRALGVWDDQ